MNATTRPDNKRETALQHALDEIEKRLRARMEGMESGKVDVSIRLHEGMIQHAEFTGTEHVKVGAN